MPVQEKDYDTMDHDGIIQYYEREVGACKARNSNPLLRDDSRRSDVKEFESIISTLKEMKEAGHLISARRPTRGLPQWETYPRFENEVEEQIARYRTSHPAIAPN